MRYPWLQSQWQILSDRLKAKTLPHGIILHGLPGLGKQLFAQDFAQYVLCESPEEDQACQKCRSCQQFIARTHPDYSVLEPEETGKAIKIDQIRELVTQHGLSSHYGRYRVTVISPAENMNQSAANSLLKVLEEPPPQTLFILVSHQISALLPTIKSRCQHLLMTKPVHNIALNWLINSHTGAKDTLKSALAMAHGAPLAALAVLQSDEIGLHEQAFTAFRGIALGSESALPIAQSWLKAPLPAPINWMYSWVSDIIKYKCQQPDAVINLDKQDDLQKLAQRVELPDILALLDSMVSLLRMQRVALNPQMTMEQLLIHWQTMTSSREAGHKTGVHS